MEQDKVWAVIPAYNEEENITQVIKETKRYLNSIIVVDDGSRDNTFKTAKSENVKVLKHIINLGKGAALKTGCDFALKNRAEKIVVLDADTQHEPSEIPNFLNELKNKEVILGYRKRNREMPFILKLGNFVINRMTKLLYNVDLHDTQCGYRAFTSEAYKRIRWKASDYSMESEMIANIGKNKLSYAEIPIKTIYVDRYKGTTIIDGIKIVLNMIWWKITK